MWVGWGVEDLVEQTCKKVLCIVTAGDWFSAGLACAYQSQGRDLEESGDVDAAQPEEEPQEL